MVSQIGKMPCPKACMDINIMVRRENKITFRRSFTEIQQ
jgi:hypothetical protein